MRLDITGQATAAVTAIVRSVVTTSADVTMAAATSTDYFYVRSGQHVVTFPTAVGNTNLYTIKNNFTTPLQPLTTSSQTIDGRSQVVGTSTKALIIYPQESYSFLSDNANWYTI